MLAKDAIAETLKLSKMVLTSYVGDMTDAELLKRPAAGCNHLAWQLGHLISSEYFLLNAIRPGAVAELPAGFVERHTKENAGSDDAAQFGTKEEYLALFDKVSAASLAALERCSPEDFDQPAPEKYRKMFPTVGSIFVLIATHPMMHAGQAVPLRRALGKPIVI